MSEKYLVNKWVNDEWTKHLLSALMCQALQKELETLEYKKERRMQIKIKSHLFG